MESVEAIIDRLSAHLALTLEVIAALLIVRGAVEAAARTLFSFGKSTSFAARREAWIHFARWLLMGLEFELAADIIRTAISPTWDDVGQLAAIAGIRTFLGVFLERDIREVEESARRAEST